MKEKHAAGRGAVRDTILSRRSLLRHEITSGNAQFTHLRMQHSPFQAKLSGSSLVQMRRRIMNQLQAVALNEGVRRKKAL